MSKNLRQRAEDSFEKYLEALDRALDADSPKASVLNEARRFFESQGIDLSIDGGCPSRAESKAKFMRDKLRELKGETGTDG